MKKYIGVIVVALMLCCMVVLVIAFLDRRKKGEISQKETEKNLKEFIERRKKLDEKRNSVNDRVIYTEFKDVEKNGGE